jgi:hypothetical protein
MLAFLPPIRRRWTWSDVWRLAVPVLACFVGPIIAAALVAPGHARLLGQTIGAALVALLLARYPVGGTQVALLVAVGVAIFGPPLSTVRLSATGAFGAEA